MTRQEFITALPELVKDYHQAPDVIHKIGNLTLVMFIGPTATGKTTLIKASDYHYVLSDNSRLPRPGEVEGIDFFFRQDYDQVADDIKNGQFVQIAIDGSGDLKATKVSSYPDSGTIAMAIMWNAVPQFRKLGFKKTISAFITPPSTQEWQRRLGQQHLSSEQLSKRLSEAKNSFKFGLTDPRVNLILNDDIESATSQLKGVAEGKVDQDREARARQAVQEILSNIE